MAVETVGRRRRGREEVPLARAADEWGRHAGHLRRGQRGGQQRRKCAELPLEHCPRRI